ncbi:MarR family winged helix-turn-helix transcriptional regulator [Streptomyces sp. NPDC053431]|uniref:MarR family winged helix-turn-helix transcriptional regulator n=1 Tax=Streptomyces sp. NPDC053431 TaxID=3365703 RepID=UPI0037D0D340
MTEPAWLNDTEMRAWTSFLEAGDLMRRQIELQLRESGVTQVQYEILTRLEERRDQKCHMTELADAMVCSRSGLTYQVSRLEKTGLLRRENDTADERAVLVSITPAGQEVLRKAAPGHVGTVRQGFFDVLTPQQVSYFADIMDTVRRHLRETSF